MPFVVYVIQSCSSEKIYIGHTSDFKKRLRQHNDPNWTFGGYTKLNKGPWKLIYKEEFATRKEAMIREKQLKSAQGRKFIHQKILSKKSKL